MFLFWLECKKLLQSPVIIVSVIACILLNIFVCYIVETNDWQIDSKEDVATEIFSDYNTADVAERIIKDNNVSGKNAENIRDLYEKLQVVVDEKAESGDSLSHYFGNATSYRHNALFGTIFGFLAVECGVLLMFTALILTNYENARNTELLVYTTKSGRKVMGTKLLAGFSVGIVLSALIFAVTLADILLIYDFPRVWNDNVSSSFNIRSDGSPFATWQSFTVAQEFWAYIGVCFVLLTGCNLLGFATGVTFRNGYAAVVISLSFNILTVFLNVFAPIGSVLKAFANAMPFWLCMSTSNWFTVGTSGIIWKNFECVGVMIMFIFFGILSIIAYKLFKRRSLS